LSGERERCLARGMTEYLAKPFKAHELFALVESGRRARARARDAAATAGLRRPSTSKASAHTLREAGAEHALYSIVDTFVRQAPDRLSALAAAVASSDGAEMARSRARLSRRGRDHRRARAGRAARARRERRPVPVRSMPRDSRSSCVSPVAHRGNGVPAPPTRVPAGGMMRILLAEDDAVAGQTLTAILTAKGHEVTAVDNGIDALGVLEGLAASRHRIRTG
jgi:CheY-like chemotaxis protein